MERTSVIRQHTLYDIPSHILRTCLLSLTTMVSFQEGQDSSVVDEPLNETEDVMAATVTDEEDDYANENASEWIELMGLDLLLKVCMATNQ